MAGTYLKEFGITEYESRLLSVLFKQSATARELSEFTEIPPTKIYQVLKDLEQRGFINVEQTEPKTYKKASAKRTINRLLRKKREELERLRSDKEGYISFIQSRELVRKCRVKGNYLSRKEISVGGDNDDE